MLKENNKVLKCSNASPDWRGYVDFVNNVVVDGLSRVICASLGYLLDQVLTTINKHVVPTCTGLSSKRAIICSLVLCGDLRNCQKMACPRPVKHIHRVTVVHF